MNGLDWIAVDWGTSSLRAWAMGRDGTVLAEESSADGMGGLAPEGFEAALLALVEGWLPVSGTVPVVACGMVGAREGWADAGYHPVPAAPLARGCVRAEARDPRLEVRIQGGLSQSRPLDVMRGEETQIAGYLASGGTGEVVVLPGTHTKWVELRDGEVFHFSTSMTGELFALLAQRSVLRHAVDMGGDDTVAFAEGFEEALARPERVASLLFGVRATALLAGVGPAALGARLSGLLLGIEFAATRPYWLGRRVALVAGGPLAKRYLAAMDLVGLAPDCVDPEATVLSGLRAARTGIREGAA
ncbi:MAG: 2-dehydro-3-deoxygalactonokinase [Pseudomonadota bacterium]